MARRRKNKALRNAVLYLMAIVVLSGVAYGYKWINHYLQEKLTTFKLVDIEITGNDIVSRNEILELCGLNPGEGKLLTVKPSEVVKKICRSPYIKGASAVRSLPSKLRISILERKPIAFIYGRGLNLIDDDGYLIPVPRNNKQWNLPFISGIDESLGSLGEKTISKNALKGVEILSYMRMVPSGLNEVISEISFSHKQFLSLILTKGGAEVRIDEQNYQENLFVLNQYFEKYLEWTRLPTFEYVDVRFTDQLIIKEKRG